MKRLALGALLPLCLLLAGGCSYAAIERQTFPICIGVDITDGGQYEFSIQAPKGDSTDGSTTYELMSATGDTLEDAMRILAASTPYPLNFCQVRQCMIGYSTAATTQLRTLLRALFELPTMRSSAMVTIALGTALDTLKAQKPEFGMRLSTHLDMLFKRLWEQNLLPDSSLAACVRLLGSGRRDPLLFVCAVNPLLEAEKTDESAAGQEAEAFAVGEPWSDDLLPEDLLAGMLPRSSESPVEYLGSAAVSDGRVSGVLTARETQAVLRARAQARLRVAIDGEQVQLQILLDESSELYGQQAELMAAVEKLQRLDCDTLGFTAIAATHFGTDAQLEAFAFRRRYSQAPVVIAPR